MLIVTHNVPFPRFVQLSTFPPLFQHQTEASLPVWFMRCYDMTQPSKTATADRSSQCISLLSLSGWHYYYYYKSKKWNEMKTSSVLSLSDGSYATRWKVGPFLELGNNFSQVCFTTVPMNHTAESGNWILACWERIQNVAAMECWIGFT